MMKTRPLTTRKAGALYLLLITALSLFGGKASAQTVTISPKTGNVVAAVSTDEELGMPGYGGTWMHEQLPMTLTVADYGDLTTKGLLSKPANNIAANTDGTFYVIGGSSRDCYMALSLPKGYHFTSYKMVFSCVTGTISGSTKATSDATLYETPSSFSTSDAYTSAPTATASGGTQTLQRTATAVQTLGNILYFRIVRDDKTFVRIKVHSFEVSFDCADPFTEVLQPTATSATGVDCLLLPFQTERIDFGEIKWQKQNNNAAFRYTIDNIQDLTANFALYDADGIANGAASTTAKKNGHITTVSADGTYYYGLKNDTYYLEVPTDALAQGTTNIPLGYRITAAKLHYKLAPKPTVQLGGTFYITDGNGKYLNTNLKYTTEKVLWSSTTAGKVYSGNTYLCVSSSGLIVKTYTLTTTTSSSNATNFTLDGVNLYYSTTFSKYYITTDGTISTSDTKATLTPESTDNSYTLQLYGTDADQVAAACTVNDDNAEGTLEVTGLNNDAIKFTVADLAGTAAYVYAELTLEALNPYISKMDVVATVESKETTLTQSYLADDFTIGEDGEINVNVPNNFASDAVKISFDNLTNKKADDTYGPMAGSGNARYHFVKSAYYDLIGENLQGHRADAKDHAYTDKVAVGVIGSQAFKVNNTEEFKTGTSQSTKSFYLEISRYTDAAFTSQGGTWDALSLTRDDTDAKACYLITCDETRYNLAPTTAPRHAFYAFYSANIKLNVQDYEPALSYVKVYESAMLQTGLDKNAYYGVKVGARNKDSQEMVADGKGYLFAKQILDQLNADAGQSGKPVDAKHVLYVDASSLNNVLSSSRDEATYGKIELLQDAIGPNAMIYLPAGVTYTLKNIASKTASGDFRAENNIVLVDKQPFFAPYDIRVDAANYTQYTRQVTSNYGKNSYLTLVLPFTIDIYDNGVHTNHAGGSSFQFYNMQLTQPLSAEKKDNYDYQLTGHFTPLTGSLTESNRPYLIHILAFEENADDQTVFVVRQNGANIVKTPTGTDGLGTRVTGETASGKIGAQSYSFTHQGSFNGEQLDGTKADYFYFAKNRFLASYNLDAPKQVYMLPFRSCYVCSTASGAKLNGWDISLDPNDDPTGIDALPDGTASQGLRLIASKGALTIAARTAEEVSIVSISGQHVAQLALPAGTSRTLSLPAGIYLVNGAKVLVK